MKLLATFVFLLVCTHCRGFVSPSPLSSTYFSCCRAHSGATRLARRSNMSAGRGLRMYDQVGPQFAHKLTQEGFTYIDVRATQEFEHGRPADSVNIPAFFSTAQGMMVNPDFVEQVAEKFPDKSSKLVLGCQMGARSAKAAEWLEEAGYETLVNVEGGFSAWARDDSLPVEV